MVDSDVRGADLLRWWPWRVAEIDTATVTPPHASWLLTMTGRQKHIHEKPQGHKHEIQPPLISLPDTILVE